MSADGWDCHVHVFDGDAVPQAGHYAPPRRTLRMLAEAAAPSGVNRFVLVQPSVYGSDNRLLLAALRETGGRHRGVVVIDESIEPASLQAMHELGVRGVRCNLVSPVGNSPGAVVRLAPHMKELGWHVQWYAPPAMLAEIAAFQARHGLTCVIDHLAGLTPSLAADEGVWHSLRLVAEGGGWLKLSGWYRLGASVPYSELDDSIRRAAEAFGEHCVWGSDWPHTMFLEGRAGAEVPDYLQTWLPVARSLSDARADRILRSNPARLYP
ncbi:amidohydrolase family protein [Ideonella sp. YS5]|uniref:amidohydrolase family protein n=1 Tax=Ideonella sp. YS5 TaxID=3453714 RepID=UPI003EE9590F